MGGNVFEWTETMFPASSFRTSLGGAFINSSGGLRSSNGPTGGDPAVEFYTIGFRVALVPEPSSFVLAALGIIGLLIWRRKH
jgi:formylglycine-generating enzyme required for sulfatase activity